MKQTPHSPPSDLLALTPTESPGLSDTALLDLLTRAKEGSDEAFRALRNQYKPLLEASVARFASQETTGQERADLAEEAERIFLCAISGYDREQDAVNFGLYAKICLHNGLISEWRRIEGRRRIVTVEDTTATGTADPISEDPAGHIMEEEHFRLLCRTIRTHLSDFENRVWWPYVTGVPISEIARDNQCSERAVHNALYRIRRKLRDKITASGTD